jgi:CheY-like chemotaxis protein
VAKPRIIVIDDDVAIRELYTLYFEELGYQVVAAADPTVCESLLNAHNCQKNAPCGEIILVDMHMPKMTGLEFITRRVELGCKSVLKQTALLSGNLTDSDQDTLNRLGCHYFHKPVRMSQIHAWVESVMQTA